MTTTPESWDQQLRDAANTIPDTGDTDGQPDGITNDSHNLPKPARAADRVEKFLRAYGDGIVYADEEDGLPPLYARDLEALRREHERANDLARQLDEARLRLDGAETVRQANADHITDLYEALGWPADTDHDDAITKATELHAEVERQDDLITVLRSKLADARLRLVDPAEKPQPGDTVRVTYPENWNRKPFTTVVGDNGIYLSQAYVESGTATVEIVERAWPTNVET